MSWKKRYLSFSEEEESPARKSAIVSVGQQVNIPSRSEVPTNSGSVLRLVAPPMPTPPHAKYQEPSPLHHPYWGVPGWGAGHCGQSQMMQQQVQLMYRQWGWSQGPGIPVLPAPTSTDLSIRPSFIGPATPSRPRSSGMDQSLDLSVRSQVKLETLVSSEEQQSGQGQPVECSEAAAAVIKSETEPTAFPPPEPDTVQNEFRAALKNGVLVPDQAGPLVVTHFVIEQNEEVELKNTCGTEVLMKSNISEKSDDRISGRSTVIKMLESIDGHEKGNFEPKTPNLGIQSSQPGPGHVLESLADIQLEKVQKIVERSEKATVPKEIENPETRNRKDGGCVDEANVSNPMIELAVSEREADLVSSIHQKMEESKKAIVLWHFLWNLLKLDTDATVIRYVDSNKV